MFLFLPEIMIALIVIMVLIGDSVEKILHLTNVASKALKQAVKKIILAKSTQAADLLVEAGFQPVNIPSGKFGILVINEENQGCSYFKKGKRGSLDNACYMLNQIKEMGASCELVRG